MTVIETDADLAPRMSWRAVLAGAVIAIAIGAMLNLLGVAMGAAALDPYDLSRGEAKGLAVAGGVWIALSNAIGLFVGAWIASRAGPHPDPWRLRTSALQPLAIWASAFLLALVIAAFSGTGFMGALVRGAVQQPAIAAEAMDPGIAPLPGDSVASEDAPAIATASAADAAEKAADATAGTAGWGFLNMLLGLIAALAGGWFAGRGSTLGGARVERERVYTTSSADPRI
jgi:hypothetical protein